MCCPGSWLRCPQCNSPDYRPNYYQDDAALLRVFVTATRHNVVVMIHAEIEAAHRSLFLAESRKRLEPRIYIVHCSVSGTVAQVAAAGARGVDAIAGTTPQYLLLDKTIYAGKNP